MNVTTLEMEPPKTIIAKSSWPKKKLADVHVEAALLCEFGCQYCSSNAGLHLRFRKQTIGRVVQDATGKAFDPHHADDLAITFGKVVQALDEELTGKQVKPGAEKTLVYSQLTDGFSPMLVKTGVARQILELLLEKTQYRIRVVDEVRSRWKAGMGQVLR